MGDHLAAEKDRIIESCWWGPGRKATVYQIEFCEGTLEILGAAVTHKIAVMVFGAVWFCWDSVQHACGALAGVFLNVEALECRIARGASASRDFSTRFEEDGGGGCVQVIDAAGEFRLECADLRGLGEEVEGRRRRGVWPRLGCGATV